MKKLVSIALILVLLASVVSFAAAEEYDDRLTPVAMLGDCNGFVLVVETALFEKGYLEEVCIDGLFDEYTQLAVMCFQADKGYVQDGVLTKVQFYWLNRTYYKEWFDNSYIVYITASGTRYHSWDCSRLEFATEIMPISVNVAENLGYLPCRVCMGY